MKRPELYLRVPDGAAEADLDLVLQDEVDDVLGMAGPHRHLDPGMRGHEFLEQLGQDVGAHGRGGGNHQVAGGSAHHLLQGVATVDQRAERAFGKRDPGPTGVGEPHAMRSAQEERRAELPFQALQARGQGRLGDEEGFGGPADAAPPGDLEEALDLHQLDPARLCVT